MTTPKAALVLRPVALSVLGVVVDHGRAAVGSAGGLFRGLAWAALATGTAWTGLCCIRHHCMYGIVCDPPYHYTGTSGGRRRRRSSTFPSPRSPTRSSRTAPRASRRPTSPLLLATHTPRLLAASGSSCRARDVSEVATHHPRTPVPSHTMPYVHNAAQVHRAVQRRAARAQRPDLGRRPRLLRLLHAGRHACPTHHKTAHHTTTQHGTAQHSTTQHSTAP